MIKNRDFERRGIRFDIKLQLLSTFALTAIFFFSVGLIYGQNMDVKDMAGLSIPLVIIIATIVYCYKKVVSAISI
jgi:hypothetical protein